MPGDHLEHLCMYFSSSLFLTQRLSIPTQTLTITDPHDGYPDPNRPLFELSTGYEMCRNVVFYKVFYEKKLSYPLIPVCFMFNYIL